MRRLLAIVFVLAAAVVVGSIAVRPERAEPVLRVVFVGDRLTMSERIPGRPDVALGTVELGPDAWTQISAVVRAATQRVEGRVRVLEIEADVLTPWGWVGWALEPATRLNSPFRIVRFIRRDTAEVRWPVPVRTIASVVSPENATRPWRTVHVHIASRQEGPAIQRRIDVSAFGHPDAPPGDGELVQAASVATLALDGPGLDRLGRVLRQERARLDDRMIVELSWDTRLVLERPPLTFAAALAVIGVCLDAAPLELHLLSASAWVIEVGSDDPVIPGRR